MDAVEEDGSPQHVSNRHLVARGELKALKLNALVVQGEDQALVTLLAEHPAMFDPEAPLPGGVSQSRDSYRFRLRRTGPAP